MIVIFCPHEQLAPAERARLNKFDESDFVGVGNTSDPADIFADLIGCKSVLDKLKEFKATIELVKSQGAVMRIQYLCNCQRIYILFVHLCLVFRSRPICGVRI